MASGYVMAWVTVTNPEQYEDYRKFSTEAMRVHGAEVCVRGGQIEVMEGDWTPERLVLLKFASLQAAQNFYHSAEYARAKAARQGAAVMRLLCVEGV